MKKKKKIINNKCINCGHSSRSHLDNAGIDYCDTCISKLNQFKWIKSEEKEWKKAYHKFK